MKLPRIEAGFCLAATVVTAAVLIVPGSADAAPAKAATTSVTSGLVPIYSPATRASRMVEPAAAAALITAYWTAARKAAAEPLPVGAGAVAPDNRPEGVPRRVAAPAMPAGGPVRIAVAFTNTEGKLFFHSPVDGRDHSCSGGAVNSGKRRLVLTAGHCVHSGQGGQWMQNLMFEPGYQFGPGPAGIFPAFQAWAQSSWINNSDHHFDYAIIITQNGTGGGRLVDTVGGNGLIVNPGRPFITFIGYPNNVANAEQQAFCQGQLSRKSIFNSDQQLNCNLGNGSSGGPWLQDYSDSNGLGNIVSNTSYTDSTPPSGPVFGPYYDDDTANLYRTAESASP